MPSMRGSSGGARSFGGSHLVAVYRAALVEVILTVIHQVRHLVEVLVVLIIAHLCVGVRTRQ